MRAATDRARRRRRPARWGEGVDGWLLRAFERLGPNAIWPMAGIGVLNAAFAITVALGALRGYFGSDSSKIGPIGAAGLGFGAVAITGTVFKVRVLLQPAFAWSRSRAPERAPAAWVSVNHGVDRAIAIGFGLFSLAYLPVAMYTWQLLQLPLFDLPLVYLFIEILVAFAAILDYFAFLRLVRPLAADIAGWLPSDYEPDYRSPPLRLRLLLVMTTVSGLVGLLVGANGTGSPSAKLTVGLALAAGVMAVIGLVPAFLLADDVTRPFHDLMAATRRVELGDLSTRVPAVRADEGGLLARRFNRMVLGLEEREVLRGAMGSYVDPLIASRVLAEGTTLAGEQVDASVMFVDIRGFTAWCEQRTPAEAVSRLNELFELIVPIIAEHGGHANKFLGDGLLASFGAPTPCAHHARAAVLAGAAIIDAVATRHGDDLCLGIGVSTGTLIVGSVGGGGRLEYGLIGDVVNVASRVEQLTKQTGDAMLVTEATFNAAQPLVGLELRGAISVPGRADPVSVHALTSSIGIEPPVRAAGRAGPFAGASHRHELDRRVDAAPLRAGRGPRSSHGEHEKPV